ncbi:CYTH domain-containing protein [Nostoc sp. MS1]|uniref:CYTH domain-containing protein n=1 Tax=Nostoc sp. MS1 TaxID=2764711 RepID=UPI001CC4164C|nr:CYTH domain-containing protein [Nostoc sp. MS1]BCL38411.1 adenylate cyclase [Nostoc sp. MS1]
MAKEIERKFLVNGDSWRQLDEGSLYRQGYIASQGATVRVRIAGNQGYLTIKGPTVNFSRSEFEYSIPLADAEEMLDTLCDRPLIEKTRYKIEWSGLVWEVDEFAGANQGLIIAEVELTDEAQQVEIPDWIGTEVTGDVRYYNSYLVKHPFSDW